jgi:beta-lactamase class A
MHLLLLAQAISLSDTSLAAAIDRITRSSNLATNIMVAVLGAEQINLTARKLGVTRSLEFNSTIPAGLPPGTRVAHKTGEITAVSHDGGIVYPPGRAPYVLVVLTRGARDGRASAALIADISRIVYQHVTRGSSTSASGPSHER